MNWFGFWKRLRRMEHKLNESEKMVSFKETSVSVAEANPILESKDSNYLGTKCLKFF
jgi:tRNA uridine 5-carboxymethylaminomethyl modification enzyme